MLARRDQVEPVEGTDQLIENNRGDNERLTGIC